MISFDDEHRNVSDLRKSVVSILTKEGVTEKVSTEVSPEGNEENEIEAPRKLLYTISLIPSTLKVEITRRRGRQLAVVLTSKANILKRKALLAKEEKTIKNRGFKLKTNIAGEKSAKKGSTFVSLLKVLLKLQTK
ncbi:hypothetical protein Trydic_g1167 [Trypoxylus dichotomus]